MTHGSNFKAGSFFGKPKKTATMRKAEQQQWTT